MAAVKLNRGGYPDGVEQVSSYKQNSRGGSVSGLSWGRPAGTGDPILLHFDVNKTVIQTDSLSQRNLEDGVREGISDMFWGRLRENGEKTHWEWLRNKPSCHVPKDVMVDDGSKIMPYTQYCKENVQDKNELKLAMREFRLVDGEAKDEMERLVEHSLRKMELPDDVRGTAAAEAAGLKGSTLLLLRSLFHLVAALQRAKRPFAILFRSFGDDHQVVANEWNKFCEMQHPLFSSLIEGIGPLDGSVPGVPDRRVHTIHTFYRDADGTVLILDHSTNGPADKSWDSWAKLKPKPTEDLRGGRQFIKEALKAKTIEGISNIRRWMEEQLLKQATGAIKDDWAWWTWNKQSPDAAKLMIVLEAPMQTKQLFFDDNIGFDSARIVDCRFSDSIPVPFESSNNVLLTKVNSVAALLDDAYFLKLIQVCHQDHLDVRDTEIDFKSHMKEKQEQDQLREDVKLLKMKLANLEQENTYMKLLQRQNVHDETQLMSLVSRESDLEKFGKEDYGTLRHLYDEIKDGFCWLENDILPGRGETDAHTVRVLEMIFLKVRYRDLILIETHAQDSKGRIQTRNYLPGMVKNVLKDLDSLEPVKRWIHSGLNVDLTKIMTLESLPRFVPAAINQTTFATRFYPIPCKVRYNEAAYVINDKAVESHKDTLSKIGLPLGKNFTTSETDFHGQVVTRFWRWGKVAAWEAEASSQRQRAAGGNRSKSAGDADGGVQINIKEVLAKLFRNHPRQEVYENMLLQMFDKFTANMLCGGFSGSIVLRVQPLESDGRPGDPCVVKLDDAESIREEFKNSVNVFKALPDRAAQILGDAVYAKNKEGQEFGGMRLELAGACWNVPELAQGSANLLSTYKDLLLYESDQMLLGGGALAGERPFGDVNTVLAETFGPGGVVSSLRKGGTGLRRSKTSLLWGWYTLKGKEGKYNPYTAGTEEYPPGPAMRSMYRTHFGEDMPDLKPIVVDTIKPKLQKLASASGESFCPLVGLAHGDLNAANIMIDALDAVWLIDFATSVDLPLFTDMCKFEMASLFEYATIPITPKVLVEFASRSEAKWQSLGVGDWLRVRPEVAIMLMRKLVQMPAERLANLQEGEFDNLIQTVAEEALPDKPHKRAAVVRALKARLTVQKEEMDSAFSYCINASKALLRGDYLLDALNLAKVARPEGKGSKGADSIVFFMGLAASVRHFMIQDILSCFREISKNSDGLASVDATALQIWLPILRESFRIVGYRDISPPQKLWSIYHCKLVAENVLRILDSFSGCLPDMTRLPTISDQLDRDLANRKASKSSAVDPELVQEAFTESASRCMFAHRDMFHSNNIYDRFLRKVHCLCHTFRGTPGLFAPVYQAFLGDSIADLVFDDQPDTQKGEVIIVQEYFEKQRGIEGNAAPTPQFSNPAFDGKIGTFDAKGGENGRPLVKLKSRLLFVTADNLQVQSRIAAKSRGEGTSLSRFSFSNWSKGLVESNGTLLPDGQDSHSKFAGMTPDPAELRVFMELDALVLNAANESKCNIKLALGCPVPCYVPGNVLCIEESQVEQAPNLPYAAQIVVLQLDESTGQYRVRNAEDPELENERKFEPQPANHIYLTPVVYKENQRILLKDNPPEGQPCWVGAVVLDCPNAASGFRHRIEIDSRDSTVPCPIQLRHLGAINSGPAFLSAMQYEEEVQKIKDYLKARNSYIIDALSGKKLDLKDCSTPTLHFFGSQTQDGSSNTARLSARPTAQRPIALSIVPGQEQDVRHGWTTLTSAVESYSRGEILCSPNAFLVLGAPGSGKSCLVRRVIMACHEKQLDLVPLRLPVADLVKRIGTVAESELDASSIKLIFQKYLAITFGEGSFRYMMVRQAISMHRALFLFERLEDAGTVMPIFEQLIQWIVMDNHLVLITSRPLLGGNNTLMESDLIRLMELQPLQFEQQRAVARTRLGLEGLNAFNQFLTQIRDSSDADEDQEDNVFGNPLMLSMLLCYLDSKRGEHSTKEAEDETRKIESEDSEQITITAVYRVAINVMLQRVQSKQQADRLNKEEKVEHCKRILEIMAFKMHLGQALDIEESDVEAALTGNDVLINTWAGLKSAVEAGHAMFLRISDDGYRFLVNGFQHFFAASYIAHHKSDSLPNLSVLWAAHESKWWAQTLEMLAEAWPHCYVNLIESRLGEFQSEEGQRDSFLHLAARVGHKPVFRLLKRFSEAHQSAILSRNVDSQTPLHVAASKGYVQICSLLIDQNAPVDDLCSRGLMPMHMAMRHGHFGAAKFLLDKLESKTKKHKHTLRKNPSISQRLDAHPAEILADRILSGGLTEEEFLEAVNETFVELSFFSKKDVVEKKRSICMLLSVFWITADQYDQFVRGQPADKRLSKASWEKLQQWTRHSVGLTSSPAILAAMLVLAAINNLGKISDMRRTFAPDMDQPFEALAHILRVSPQLIPSFSKLDGTFQPVIQTGVEAEFNFGQFLQAENLPASLSIMKLAIDTSAEGMNVLGFLLFRIFASMCAILAAKSLEGSLFMTEVLYANYNIGLDVCHYLKSENVQDVYYRFLAARARAQGLSIDEADRESRAVVRLACLTRCYTPEAAKEISEAFQVLTSEERSGLTSYLGADGIEEQGFLLYLSPAFLEGCVHNKHIGLVDAFRMLYRIFEAASQKFCNSSAKMVQIVLGEMIDYAKTCDDKQAFRFTNFIIVRSTGARSDNTGTLHLCPWQLQNNDEKLLELEKEGGALAKEVLFWSLREPMFQKRLLHVFPEVSYFYSEVCGDDVRVFLKQTLGGLFVTYWVANDQAEAFTRGQATEDKLTSASWEQIRDMVSRSKIDKDPTVLDAMFVAMAISALGKIPLFSEQLAPGITNPKQVLLHVIETRAGVLPSFKRLDPEYQNLVRECATLDFNFEKFIHAESLPFNLEILNKKIQTIAEQDARNKDFLDVFTMFAFAILSGSRGHENLEGSLYMTEGRCRRFIRGKQALQKLVQGSNAQEAYAFLLNMNEEALTATGVNFEETKSGAPLPDDEKVTQRRALLRLACLVDVDGDPKALQVLVESFMALNDAERKRLSSYLTADAYPAFFLDGLNAFLRSAWYNPEIRMDAAIRILLRVYDAAAIQFRGAAKSIINIGVAKLTQFTTDFFGSASFQDMQFEITKLVTESDMDEEIVHSKSMKMFIDAGMDAEVIPKLWIPVTNQTVLDNLKKQGMELAAQILAGKLFPENFKVKVGRVYPEISYFTSEAKGCLDQTYNAMLTVLKLISKKQDSFVKGQSEDDQLSRQSWAWLQDWMAQRVKLSDEVIDAVFVFLLLQNISNIKQFIDELSTGFDNVMTSRPIVQILASKPEVVPSFSRLSTRYQSLIKDALGLNISFFQFVQAEIVPANLSDMKERLMQYGDEGFGFFCFGIFVQACGTCGDMTQSHFNRFRPGLEALQQLDSLGAPAAYDAFLYLRSTSVMSRFASIEHRALARLFALTEAFDRKDGARVCEAFDELAPDQRSALAKWLNLDGIDQCPGIVFRDASQFLSTAQKNPAVGLTAAFKMLLRVQAKCAVREALSAKLVVVHLGKLVEWADKTSPKSSGDFASVSLIPHWEIQGEVRIVTIDTRYGPAVHSGWLEKRGPTVYFSWQKYWCELMPGTLFCYGDQTRSSKKHEVRLYAKTRAEPFTSESVPGEAVKYRVERPHGFVLDSLGPEGGQRRRCMYFDAGNREQQEGWTSAIASVVHSLQNSVGAEKPRIQGDA